MAWKMGLLGKKVGMTQVFDNKGDCVPLTVVELGPNVVLEVKSTEKHGYTGVQLAFDEKKVSRVSRPLAGVFAKAKTTPKRFMREVRLPAEDAGQFAQGQVLTVAQVFRQGDIVDISGTSRGKGFQGVMKRHHFSGFRATHGTHEYFRHGGSIGCRLTPGRTHKGKRMGGQMGNKPVTIQNIRVHEIIPEKNLMLLNGAVPGAPDGYILIRIAAKRPQLPFLLIAAPQPAETAAAETAATPA